MPPDTAVNSPDARRALENGRGWQTLRRFLPYLWPRDNAGLRWRIVGAMVMVLCAKATTLALPYLYKRAIDAMTKTGAIAGDHSLYTLALAFVLAYAGGRFAGVMFDNLRASGGTAVDARHLALPTPATSEGPTAWLSAAPAARAAPVSLRAAGRC